MGKNRLNWIVPALVAALVAVGSCALPANADPNDFPGGGFHRPIMRVGQLQWSGNVDDTTVIYVHRDSVRTVTISGKDATNVNPVLRGRLPRRPEFVDLTDVSGRGDVRIVQEPNPRNDFTAAVRIHDPQPGRGFYSFTLRWRPRFY
ncbi:MAG: hypothetical protein ACLQVD_10110 [Capsulimonadaceae bacterium]